MTVALDKAVRSARKAKGAGYLRRAEILEAAERIFLRDGYEGATIRKIADEVGVSSTALYMHFRDKSEILVEISENAFAQLIAQNQEIAALPMDPATRVRRMVEAYMQFGLANPNAYQLVFGQPPKVSAEKSAVLLDLGQRCYQPFRAAVQALADTGKLRCTNVDVTAQVSWAAAHGTVALIINHPNFTWAAEAEHLVAATLETLFQGLMKA